MSTHAGGLTSRSGLSSRPNPNDQVQIHINPGKFDFDSEVEGLRAHVGKIKQLSLAIEDERKQQGEIINSLDEALEKAKLALRRAMGRLNIAYKQAQSYHLLFLLLFIVVFVLGLYIVAKVYKLGSSILW